MKKALKIGGITLLSLVGFLVVCICILSWLVLTPARLTPIVNRLADKYVACETEVKRIDLTLFSTFPNVGLRLEGVTLLNPFEGAETDTVAAFDRCEAVINLKAYLKEEAVILQRLELENGKANLYVAADGKSNFDLFGTGSVEEPVDTGATELPFTSIDLQQLALHELNVCYHDCQTGTDARIEGLNVEVRGAFKEKDLEGKVEASVRTLAASLSGESPLTATVRNFRLKTNAQTYAENGKGSLKLTVEEVQAGMTDLVAHVNQLALEADGTLKDEQWSGLVEGKTEALQFSMQGETPLEVATDGIRLKADGTLAGATLSCNPLLEVPELNVEMNHEALLQKATVRLSLPVQTDTAFHTIQVEKASVALNEYQLALDGKVETDDPNNLKGDLRFETNHWNLQRLLTMIPSSYQSLLEGIHLKGGMKLQGSLTGGLKEGQPVLEKGNGQLALDHIDLLYNDSIALQTPLTRLTASYPATGKDASFKEFMQGTLQADRLNVQMTGMADAELNGLDGSFGLSDFMDSTQVLSAKALLKMTDLRATMDTLEAYTFHPQLEVCMTSTAEAQPKPIYTASLACDTLFAAMGRALQAGTRHFKMEAKAVYDSQEKDLLLQWNPQLNFNLQNGVVEADMLSLPLSIPHIQFDFTLGKFIIHDSRILLGNSDFALQGEVFNIDSFLNHTGLLKAELDFNSRYTNVNQLMDLVSGLGATDSTATETAEAPAEAATSTTTPKEDNPFMVPLGIDARLNTHIQTAGVNGFDFKNVGGKVTVRDGVLVLEEMGFTSEAARMQLTAMYKSPRKNHLFVGFDFHLLDIQIDDLIRMIPDVDSIVPMLKAFSGEAQFHLAAETYLKSNYDIKMSTLRGAGAIEGKNLVLMDNTTFSEISKYLLFSKKTKNVVDSVSVEMTVFRDEVDLYPFLISMDKWQAVVGGRHNINENLDFNYHISLTDCPLPARLGLDITGTLDDMKFKLAPCKYANLYKPEKRNVTQARVLELKKIISTSLKDNVKPQESVK